MNIIPDPAKPEATPAESMNTLVSPAAPAPPVDVLAPLQGTVLAPPPPPELLVAMASRVPAPPPIIVAPSVPHAALSVGASVLPLAGTLTMQDVQTPAQPAAPLNVKEQGKRMSKARIGNLALRAVHWPTIQPEDLWLLEDRKRGGFAQVPRTLSMMMNLINDIIKRRDGKAVPAGRTYLVLWLRVFDDGFLRIDDERDAAFEAGYEGERRVATFRAHMRILQELGFIDFKEGPRGPTQYVLMLNPYKVAKQLHDNGFVPTKHYSALIDRASAIGSAKEFGS